jgi:MoxR-like ATPase/phage terminase small subunit
MNKTTISQDNEKRIIGALSLLTPKQRIFVRLLVVEKVPALDAVKRAGYETSAHRALRRMMKNSDVMAVIKTVEGFIGNESKQSTETKQESTKQEGKLIEHDLSNNKHTTTTMHKDATIIAAASTYGSGSKTDHVPATAKGSDALRDALREIIGDTLDEARVTAIARSIVKQEVGLAPVRIQVCEPCGKVADMGTQHRQFNKLVTKLAAGCNVYLAGPAGTGKTTGARSAATALSKMWGRDVRFEFNGAIDSEHKLLGFVDAQGRIVSRPFRKAFTEGGVYLFDEVDASLAGALLAFNAALANSHCDFPDGCFEKHPDFRCVAAANTWGFGATHDYVGRNKLDEAFRDRFVMLNWDTDEALERHIALTNIEDENLGSKWITYVQQCRAKAKTSGIRCVISPRASIYGCALLQAGEAWDEVSESCVRKGMPDESWKQINA